MTSQSVRAPAAAAAVRIASRSATRPSTDCTSENATRWVDARISSASDSTGTCRTVTPRSAWARNGKTTDAKSPSTVRTSAPSGTLAATRPTSTDACEPTATHDGSTRTSRANAARDARTASSYAARSAFPACHRSSAACMASAVARAGSPHVAASR